MKDWSSKEVGRRSFVGAALLLLGLVAGDDAGKILTPLPAIAAQKVFQSPAPGQPRSGGTLRFGIVKDIGTPIPFVDYTSVPQFVKENMYEPLVMNDQKGEIHPWLAQSWTANANSSQWTFKIRQGVKFHDGKELTAEDVVWSAKHIMNPANGAAGQGQLSSNVREVVALDKYTVRFTLPGPRGLLPEILSNTSDPAHCTLPSLWQPGSKRWSAARRLPAPAPSNSRRGFPVRKSPLSATMIIGAALHISTVFASASSPKPIPGPPPFRQGTSTFPNAWVRPLLSA